MTKRRGFSFLIVVLLWLSLGGSGMLANAQAYSPWDGIFLGPESARIQGEMGKIENQLYGHSYEDQGLSKRLSRVERTLFGTSQNGSATARFQKVQSKIQQQQDAKTSADQGPMVEYLEQKFFFKTFPSLPFDQRIHQLEEQVFGKTFDKLSLDQRLKKLAYTVPLMAKEIRLTKQGAVLASTAKRKPTASTPQAAPRFAEVPELSATAVQAVSSQDFFDNVYQLPSRKALRWTALPVQVYIRGGSPEERDLALQAVAKWNMVFPIKVIALDNHADILMDWNNAAVPIGPITQPILHFDQEKTIRTVVLVNMTPYKSLQASEKLRAILHQLGHAAGLWGHSENPQDIMYPTLAWERSDIPHRWNPKPISSSGKLGPGLQPNGLSERDKTTMLQLYSHPAQDIRAYSLP